MERQEKPPKRYYHCASSKEATAGSSTSKPGPSYRSSRRMRPQRESWLLILLVVYGYYQYQYGGESGRGSKRAIGYV
jgi:hypothetical protein